MITYNQTETQLHGKEYTKCVQAIYVEDDDPPCSANTALYLISVQQYVICCLTFSIAKPFRKPIWQNPIFFISVYTMLIYQTYLFYNIDDWSSKNLNLLPIPDHFKKYLFVLFLFNSVLTYTYEKVFITWFTHRYQALQNHLKEAEFEQMLEEEKSVLQGSS